MSSKLDNLFVAAVVTVPLALALLAQRAPEAVDADPRISAPIDVAAAAPEVEVDLAELCGEAAATDDGAAPELDVECPIGHVEPAPEAESAALGLVYEGKLVIRADVDRRWASGVIHHTYQDGSFTAWRGVAHERLPAAIAAMRGTSVVVHGAEGRSCVAEIGELSIYAEEFGDIFWSEAEVPTRSERRAHARTMLEEPLALVATLKGAAPCGDGLAWPIDAAPPVTYTRAPLDESARAALRSRVLPLLADEHEYREMAAGYASYLVELGPEEAEESGSWDDFVGRRLEVIGWREVGGPRRLLAVELRDEYVGCGDGFDGEAAWLFEVVDGELRRLPQPGAFDIKVMLDADHDGALEHLSQVGDSLTLAGDVPAKRAFDVPFIGCPC
ncbi:MAG: hypothetical protein H6711_34950 [Myxococcales bacterium]|nr:hypothetical protein [Myxococcales bacterium]